MNKQLAKSLRDQQIADDIIEAAEAEMREETDEEESPEEE